MALIVGVDSYVTVEEADKMLGGLYLDNNEVYKKWQTLTESQKEVLLRASCRDLDNLRYTGEKKNYSQKLQFPRKTDSICGYGYRLYISQLCDNGLVDGTCEADGLNEIALAQVENAIWHSYVDDVVVEQAGLNITGLTSKIDALRGIYTQKVYSILSSWLCDSRLSI